MFKIVQLASFILFFSIVLTSCSTSHIMINKPYEQVKSHFIEDGKPRSKDLSCVQKKDTFLVISQAEQISFENIYLFKEDRCYYQKMNIYCSPCAEEMVENILDDKTFDFKAIDEVNYVSLKKENVILRLRDKRDDKGSCNEITIHKVL